MIRSSRAFSRTEFDRRMAVEVEGMRVAIATAEDVVLAKLECAKLGEREWAPARRASEG